ncbi:protein kinase family protein [Saccharomonospora marina XMU15]|uniref:non-specific serine/threonine protein kinase n=1 Tax=Saccharomonospora marina XMU15 TaxID=882083 RepID=H5X7B4_9PSEU|nr:serine/threonine-protein kinase [Saccharomonospora marina]EHR49075.1 protein kinase family protein [Saccharomonospora marina XMU15]
MSDEGRLVAGRYRVIKRIGTGAMGAVWQAHDEVLHRTVAIKQLLLQPGLDEHEAEDARQRTMREGRIAARLHHPNAITVFDVVTDDNGQPCLIMEYLASTSLAEELRQRTTLPPLEVAKIGAQIAAALKEAHAVGIVHRDIKPGNILLTGSGLVKITDFGISRAKDDVTVTKTGMIAGTPAYLAPEVAIGGNPGPESDIFSLGSTLYAATEGQPPFGLSENTLSLLHAVAAGQINPPRQSGPLASVLAVMLHPDTRHRPTAQECEELLSAVARGETPIGGGTDDPTRLQSSGPGSTAVLGAAGAGAIGGALGAAAANDDAMPTAHSGNLGEGANGPYGAEGPAAGHYAAGYPGQGYPTEPYDGYPGTAAPDRTRAVPYGDLDDTADYGVYRGYGRDEYGDYDGYGSYEGTDDAHYDERYEPYGDPADDQQQGNWKIPAAIGSVVVVGMAAFAFWVFGSPGGSDAEQEDPPQRPVATTSQMSSPTPRPTTTTSQEPVETVETETSVEEYTPQPEPPPPPETTAEPTEETSTTTSTPPVEPTSTTTETSSPTSTTS